MRRLALAFVCAGLLAAAYAPAAAAVTVLPVSGQVVVVDWTDDGVEAFHGAPTSTPFGDVPWTVYSVLRLHRQLPALMAESRGLPRPETDHPRLAGRGPIGA